MRTKIVKIGNSRGIRLPKSFIEESLITDEVELTVENNRIIIMSASTVRQNWGEAFKKTKDNKDDTLLDKDSLSTQTVWDNEEWEW